ncbi:hypothetical protein LPJ53_000209 [Coemansia erecta]|uniref:Protein-L-isoaspartate O-methyltransferase n=1 Tax=Coemansia erecta TaxID=147472 RepID=A0A9W7Y995_9FUNG|nr:hypothetical protein LPJ53_000209 [Coemansia erecta]
MAWSCSGNTNDELVARLTEKHIIKSEPVISAMRAVDRGHFVDYQPYQDSPQTIGYGATISAPHMHGYALENLKPYLQSGMNVLDVGSGSGYLTACMAAMVGTSGRVVGIDHIPELVDASKKALDRHYPEWLKSGRIRMIVGDGRKGYMPDAPYDCIHVGAASPSKPQELLEQLKSPGRMFVPVGTSSQRIIVYDKDADGNISQAQIMGVLYVPLTDPDSQRTS